MNEKHKGSFWFSSPSQRDRQMEDEWSQPGATVTNTAEISFPFYPIAMEKTRFPSAGRCLLKSLSGQMLHEAWRKPEGTQLPGKRGPAGPGKEQHANHCNVSFQSSDGNSASASWLTGRREFDLQMLPLLLRCPRLILRIICSVLGTF